jgi:hypothetical protein
MDVPLVVRNGTGPIDMICAYEVDEDENGLVIKWFHEAHQIYQWIPPSNLPIFTPAYVILLPVTPYRLTVFIYRQVSYVYL